MHWIWHHSPSPLLGGYHHAGDGIRDADGRGTVVNKFVLHYRDLPDTPAWGICLYCPVCVEEYSATKGDYFIANSEDRPICGECDGPLQLMRRRVVYEPVSV